jgi:16S rRNA (adenine1518-N6/adenine1519-N6)-dimethyltransferase
MPANGGLMHDSMKHDQHFMTDRNMIKRIVSAAQIRGNETVLEIGSGKGFLTKDLAEKAEKVIAIEIDRSLERELTTNLDGVKNVELAFGNALKMIKKLSFDKIVSNIPYAISEPLIQEMVFLDFNSAVLTLPKSFADRMNARPDDRRFSRLSIISREFLDVRVLFEVPKEAFDPMPKTASSVVFMKPRQKKNMFCRVYLKRKKKLKNAIMQTLFESRTYTKNQARKHIKSLKFNSLLEKKASEMDTEELKNVWKRLQEMQ